MNNTTQILRTLDYESALVNADDIELESLSPVKRRAVHEVKGFGIDSIYFSGEFPSIYFKSIKNFEPEYINEICSIHRRIWNQGKVPFLYVSSPAEIRIYNCCARPVRPEKDELYIKPLELFRYAEQDDQKRLTDLIKIFGKVSLESGRFREHKSYANQLRLENKVDKTLIKSLKETRTKLVNLGIAREIVHNLLTRSLFILYLEDRGATTPTFYRRYLPEAKSYFDILDDKNAAYRLFETLEESFNGGIFTVKDNEKKVVDKKHLRLIKDCFWSSLLRWRPFDFSIIPIELISEIYEEFLKTKIGEKQASKTGTYYTRHSLVEFILNEQLPWADKNNSNYKLKILDPACGSGIFLVEAYKRLVDRWKYCNKGKKIDAGHLKNLLLNSIYGIEIQADAIKVAAFSLYLAVLDYLEPKYLWNRVKFPFLIFDPEDKDNKNQGYNLFRTSSLSEGIFSEHKYDLVIGNPPFKRGNLDKEANRYLKNLGFAQEYAVAFLHRAPELSPTGKIALVATSKILFNKTNKDKNFRKFLFNDNYVEAIYNFSIFRKAQKRHGGSLFVNAVGPVCVVFYRKTPPAKPNRTLLYCAPKSPLKKNMIDGLVIESSDFKFLPREECKKTGSNIWKVAMWGTAGDYEIINRLNKYKSLQEYFESRKETWNYGTGLHRPDDDGCYVLEFANFPLIPTQKIERFYTDDNNLNKLGKDANYRPIDGKIFIPPMVLVKQGQKNKRFCASYIPFKCVYLNAVYGITTKAGSKVLKALTAYLNSSFSTYYLFLAAAHWGVEREIIKLNELLFLPDVIFKIPGPEIEILAKKVDEIIESKKTNPVLQPGSSREISRIEKEIDEIIYIALDLSEREKYLIEDVLEFSLDLFQEGEKSAAYFPAPIDDLENYAKILCEDLNDILEHSDSNVWASIYETEHYHPLTMVAVRFSMDKEAGAIEKISVQAKIGSLLNRINDYTYEKFSESIYFRKVVKYYDGDTIFVVKPNERRFWSRAAAMSDAGDIIAEVSSLE